MSRIAREISRFTKKEIDQAFSQARRVLKHPGFDILVAPAQKEFGRILVIASRRVGNAPARNKIKRQLKSLFYENQIYTRGNDYIVIVRAYATTLSFTTIKDLFLSIIEPSQSQLPS